MTDFLWFHTCPSTEFWTEQAKREAQRIYVVMQFMPQTFRLIIFSTKKNNHTIIILKDWIKFPICTIWNSEETSSFKWTFLLILLLIFFPEKSHLIYLNLTPNLHREDLHISLNQQEGNFKVKYNVCIIDCASKSISGHTYHGIFIFLSYYDILKFKPIKRIGIC